MPRQTSNTPSKTTNQTTVDQLPKRGVSRRFGRWFLFVLLVLIWLAVWQHQAVSDWYKLYGYEPPAAITKLAQQTTMNERAKHLFYINHPEINSRQDFFKNCHQREKTIVLGCYHGGQSGIFILEIHNNSELAGVEQVTAAHEMLHAAYDRLSSSEQEAINTKLRAFYNSGKLSESIEAEIEAYKKTEPDQILNEMHSIFGTEVVDLPAELEEYYRQYFSSRQAVTDYAAHYQQAFRQREDKIEQYERQLASLKSQIEAKQQSLAAQRTELEAKRAELKRDEARGYAQEYNRDAEEYNGMVRRYNSLLNETRNSIDQYNDLVKTINSLVVEEQELIQQLNGKRLTPQDG